RAARLRDPVLRLDARAAPGAADDRGRGRIHRIGRSVDADPRVDRSGPWGAAVDHRVLRLQPGPLRDAVRVWIRSRQPPGVPRTTARPRPVLAGTRPD